MTWKMASFLLLVLLAAFRTIDALLDVVPDNEAVLEGSNATLRCSAHPSTPAARVMWIEFTMNPLGIVLSDLRAITPSHPNAARYSILGTGLDYFLHIRDARLTDGGRYQCTDAEGQRPGTIRGSAELVVLESHPVCNELITVTGRIIEGRYYVYECLINYQGFFSPVMKWEGPGEFDESFYITGRSVWRSAMFRADRLMESHSFECTTNFTASDFYPDEYANNTPSYRHVYTGMPLDIAWPPLNANMVVSPVKEFYVEGDVLICSVDAKPTPTFVWGNMRTLVQEPPGATYVIPPALVGTNQSMRCDAQILLEGSLYTAFVFQNVNVPAITTPTTPSTLPPTTPPPEDAPCDDLTGHWVSTNPSAHLCIEMDNRGNIITLLRNGTDMFFVQGTGKTVYGDYRHIGFTAIWPSHTPLGVGGFTGECHKCFGSEVLLMSGLARNKARSPACGVSDGTQLTRLYIMTRQGPPCRDAELDVYNPNARQMEIMGVRARAYNGPF